MSRSQLTLSGLLLLQLLSIVLIRAPFGGARADSGEHALITAFADAAPVHIEILGQDDERLELYRDGESWSVGTQGGFPAERTKIDELIRDLQAIRVRRPVVGSARYHKTFKVSEDQPEGRLRLWSADDDTPRVDLILGSSSNYRTTHARLAGQDEVYEIRGLAPFDLRPQRQAWIRKALLQRDADEIVGFSLTNAKGRFELQKQDDAWVVSHPEIDPTRAPDAAKIEALLDAATALRLDDVADEPQAAERGLETPAATLVLHVAGETEPLTLRVGAAVEGQDEKLYVSSSELDAPAISRKGSVSRLLDAALDDLLKAKAEPPVDPAGS